MEILPTAIIKNKALKITTFNDYEAKKEEEGLINSLKNLTDP
jgi:hypothetical protein